MTEPDRLFSIGGFLAGCLRTLPGALRASGPRPPAAAHTVPADFLGICVAASDDPAGDAFVLCSLREAGLRDVRLDITYGYENAPAGRLLKRLLADDFRVLLHLVQPFDEARLLPAADALDRWARFTRSVFSAHRGAAVSFEAGSTCNRRKWTGYRTLNDFLLAWRAALAEARAAGVPLAGVNVTDFEPVYNAGLLELLRRRDLLPAVQTDNLFAERATEPEAYDPKILGPRLAGLARFNLVRKALLLAAVGRAFGLETLCTHTAWSERRIRRLLEDADQKQADYLARYLLLAAASGALRRVYWGPLIGQREGLVDDGTQEYPEPIPHVTFYGRAPGDPARYRRRPAFDALRTLAAFLPGASWSKALASGPDVTILEFRTARGVAHAAWTRNGRGADLDALYLPADLAAARLLDRDGRAPGRAPAVLTEAPLYLFWDDGRAPRLRKPAALMPDLILARPLERRHQPVQFAGWRGILGLPADRWPAEPVPSRFLPDRLEAAQKDVLRKARNTVWVAADPLVPGGELVVKRAKAQAWHKRLLSLYQPSKARRSWNSACEMERRGVATPEPVAFFERPVRHAALSFSYYVCRRFAGADSVRTAFTAFAGGAESFQGMPRVAFYEVLARFLGRMHERGVYHRDLSAGNVLAQVQGDGRAAFSVIDTGRARFFPHPLPERLRLADLKRLCHPLTWPERDAFMSLYLSQLGLAFTGARRLPFRLYDWKHALKKKLRPLRGK
jgi:hypothetical protein